MSTFTKLREGTFSATERRIADYILKNAERMNEITISTVAEECNTSKSMVVQLCKAAGFSGYKDLCSQLLVEQALSGQRNSMENYEDIHPGCSVKQIAQITIRGEIRSLEDTAELIDYDALEEAVSLLRNADRIVLFGVGNSAVIALDMHYKLSRIGLPSRFSSDLHLQLMEIAPMTENSVAVVISFNGRTRDMIEACELSRERGAKILSLTRHGRNPISEMSDVALHVASNESLQRAGAMSSRMSTMSMVDVLFTCLSSQMADEIAPLLHRSTAIAKRRRKTS